MPRPAFSPKAHKALGQEGRPASAPIPTTGYRSVSPLAGPSRASKPKRAKALELEGCAPCWGRKSHYRLAGGFARKFFVAAPMDSQHEDHSALWKGGSRTVPTRPNPCPFPEKEGVRRDNWAEARPGVFRAAALHMPLTDPKAGARRCGWLLATCGQRMAKRGTWARGGCHRSAVGRAHREPREWNSRMQGLSPRSPCGRTRTEEGDRQNGERACLLLPGWVVG